VDVGDIADVLKVHGASILRAEVCKVGGFKEQTVGGVRENRNRCLTLAKRNSRPGKLCRIPFQGPWSAPKSHQELIFLRNHPSKCSPYMALFFLCSGLSVGSGGSRKIQANMKKGVS
jgi:hypothetical protein